MLCSKGNADLPLKKFSISHYPYWWNIILPYVQSLWEGVKKIESSWQQLKWVFSAGELMSSNCCFYRLLYMDPSAMRSLCFLKYFGKYPQEPGRKKKEWASWGGLIQEHIKEKFNCGRVKTKPRNRQGEVVLCNSCLAKTSCLVFFPLIFPSYFLFLMKRTSGVGSGVGVFLATAVSLCQELPFRVNISCPLSVSFSLQPQEGWVSSC